MIGTDADVDRRLSAVAQIDIPFYSGLKIGVPSLPATVDALAEGRYDLVHLCSPGPAGSAAWLLARVLELPVLGSYHTELAAYAGVRSGQAQLEAMAAAPRGVLRRLRRGALPEPGQRRPAPSSDRAPSGSGAGTAGSTDAVRPGLRTPGLLPPDVINVLYAGRLTTEKGVELLADAFLAARRRDPRLHLVLAGGGPEERALRERLGEHATFLGWLGGDDRRAPTRAPTCSCSRARPTRSGRWCSRRRPAAAGRRGRRRRPAVADRERRHRRAHTGGRGRARRGDPVARRRTPAP